jgi:hypothetical protein
MRSKLFLIRGRGVGGVKQGTSKWKRKGRGIRGRGKEKEGTRKGKRKRNRKGNWN